MPLIPTRSPFRAMLARAAIALQAPWWMVWTVFAPKGVAAAVAVIALGSAGVQWLQGGWRRPVMAPGLVLFALLCAASTAWSIVPGFSALAALRFCLLLAGAMLYYGTLDGFGDEMREKLAGVAVISWAAALALLCAALAWRCLPERFGLDALLAGRLNAGALKSGVIILVVTYLPVIHLYRAAGRRPGWLIWAALAPLVLAGKAAESSSALMALCAALPVWALAARFPHAVRRTVLVLIPALLLAMPVLILALPPEATAKAIPHFPPSFFHRLVIWDFVHDRILDRPLLGWGADSGRAVPGGGDEFVATFAVPWSAAPYTGKYEHLPLHPHNLALETWLNVGLAGVLALAWALVSMLASWLKPGDSALAVRAGWVVGGCVVALVSFGMWQMWWLALLMLAAGLFRLRPRAA